MTCNMSLESSQRGLQLYFRPHLNLRSAREVMGSQVAGVPTLAILGLPFGSPKTKNHLDVGHVGSHIVYYKGEGGGFPQVRAVVSLVSLSCPWLVLTPKVLQLCTNHLMLVLCRSMWVVEACQFFLVRSRSSSMPLYPSKVLRAKERAPIFCSFAIFCLGFTFEFLKELGARQLWMHQVKRGWTRMKICKGSMGEFVMCGTTTIGYKLVCLTSIKFTHITSLGTLQWIPSCWIWKRASSTSSL
jgi:hypothetical protein